MSRPSLSPGDKVPNFFLADAAGTRRQFQGETDGRPILLLAVGKAAEGAGLKLLQALVESEPGLNADGIQTLVVAGDAPDRLAQLQDEHGVSSLVFPDANSGLLPFLLQSAASTEAAAFLLDPNQRVLTIDAAPPASGLPERARAWFQGWAEGKREGALLDQGAPVLVLPRIFSPDFCDRLIGLWHQEHHEGGLSDATRNVQDTSKKKTLEHVIQDQALIQEIAQTLHRRIGPELAKGFMYAEPYAFESFIVMSYKPERKDFFGSHRDRYEPSHPRRFAVSLNLNEGFEGGELRFPEYGPHWYRPGRGGAAVFSCSLLHEARPVQSGQRFVMTAFFNATQQAKPSGRGQGGA